MRWRSLFAFALAAGMAAPTLAQAQDTRPGIAVWIFENGGSYGQDAQDFEALQVGLQQILLTELARNPAMRIVERRQLQALMEEQNLGGSGRVDANTAARIGQLIGAKYMIFGSFVDFFGDFRIDARIVSVETSELVKTQQVRDDRENLYDMMVDLAGRLTEDVELPALSREIRQEVESREIPTQAVTYYSRAIFFEDRGDTDRAEELYSRALDEFPEYTEARQALQQLRRSS